MNDQQTGQSDSMLQDLIGLNVKEFIIVAVVAYLSILTIPMVVDALGLPRLPMVIGIMALQYFLLYTVGKMHGKSILKTMTSNGFLGWIMWFALVCMLMLPIIHLLSLFGVIPDGGAL